MNIDSTLLWLIGLVVGYILTIIVLYKVKPEWFTEETDSDDTYPPFMPPF